MKKRYFKKGAEIIKEGMLSDCAYIIESGSVQVSKILSNGEEQVIGVLEENDIFGEMSLIDGLPRSATVLALEDCTISVMTPEVFNSLSKRNPEALMPILKVLASRLRKALNILEQVEGQKTLIQPVPAEV
ncbi:MAG: cyclic nucleotide-binding domain-containing protein [Nitrospina sp.]|jgi:CRP/FNR family transcriptional regulator, cyclic AMP receptor protein|nr:cyclic nucleotide-binding domain-containing protein [Nitrospina sp.]MBT3416406.1 cyclic nucleotide-binding domain-containing protein [Nitrospina sp.]MBT3855425.1 cyclic nucleotide-binding domain-containing protein [Nitrospina sp.]MBT4103940.1 cyclic nucleotide-binding domain-containing protein [Nitrospina sp.]MBT4388501.1 cyclic nucleotide-binding domain-containing protein [Nitrospina sp.]